MTTQQGRSGFSRILDGPLGWEVARFGTPLALAMGLQVTFNLVDAYIIARLDPHVAGPALGAIGICDQIAAIGSIISYGVSIATAALLGQQYGKGDREAVTRTARQSLLVVLALSAVLGVLGVGFASTIIRDVVQAKGEVARLSVSYLRVMLGGSFSIFLLLQLTSIQRALGSSKTPVVMLVGSNALNLVLAVLFCYGSGPAPEVFAWGPPIAKALHIPRMELLGAAWATIGARTVFLVPLVVLIERRFRLFRGFLRTRLHMGTVRSITSIAWPASAQLVVRLMAMLLTHSLVARAFTTASDQRASTALGIVFRLETLALFVALGWGSAAQTFLAQNIGAGQFVRGLKSGKLAALYNAVFMLGLTAVLYQYSDSVVGFFDSDAVVVHIAKRYFSIVAPSYVALGTGIVLGSAITGTGATRVTLMLDSFVVVACQLPLSLWAVWGDKASTEHLWWALAVTNVVFWVVYAREYRKGTFVHRMNL